jgi:ferric-dicitrate binding protein FerR (iron transport regulator)
MAEPIFDDALERIAELARRAAARSTTDAGEALSQQRFLARLDFELLSPRRQWTAWSWLLPTAGLPCVAVAIALLWRRPALTFTVDGAEQSGQYVSAIERAPVTLRFSDASSVVATPGSRLRIEDTTPRGARVLLERGEASVRVVHSSSTAWTFAVGPFEVHVTGTRFDLSWDPAQEKCEVTLREGSVEIRGPSGSGPIVLRGQQRFRGDAKQHSMQVLEL